MKAFVSRMYSAGKRIPSSKKIATHCGDLNMSDRLHPILCRIVSEACLLSECGEVIPQINDVRLIGISAKGLRLRGIEVNGDKETAQEWWVRFEE